MTELRERARAKLESFARTEISSRPLALIRIFVTLTMFGKFAGPMVGWRVGPASNMALWWIVFAAAGFVCVGYKTRWATVILAVAFGVLHLYYGAYLGDPKPAKPVQTFQLIVLLAVTPSGRSLSVDRYLEKQRARAEGREPEPERMPWWQLELFLLQIVSIYVWASYDKSDAKWFRGERMERYYVKWYGGSDSFVYSPIIHPVAVVLAWSTTILEYTLVVGLMSRRFRKYVVVGSVLLHLGILFMFSVPYFTMMMLTVALACSLPPDKIHEFVTSLGGE